MAELRVNGKKIKKLIHVPSGLEFENKSNWEGKNGWLGSSFYPMAINPGPMNSAYPTAISADENYIVVYAEKYLMLYSVGGKLIWQKVLAAGKESKRDSVEVYKKHIYICYTNKVEKYSIHGELIWSKETSFGSEKYFNSLIIIDNTLVCVQNAYSQESKRFYSFDLNGNQLNESYTYTDMITILNFDGDILAITNGKIYCYKLSDFSIKWYGSPKEYFAQGNFSISTDCKKVVWCNKDRYGYVLLEDETVTEVYLKIMPEEAIHSKDVIFDEKMAIFKILDERGKIYHVDLDTGALSHKENAIPNPENYSMRCGKALVAAQKSFAVIFKEEN